MPIKNKPKIKKKKYARDTHNNYVGDSKLKENYNNHLTKDTNREIEKSIINKNFFEDLPVEIINLFVNFLSLKEIARLSLANKNIRTIINDTYCHNLSIWGSNFKGKKIIRPATFKEVSDDRNHQISEIDLRFNAKEQALRRKLAMLALIPESGSVKYFTCTIISALLGCAAILAITIKLMLDYGEEDVAKIVGMTLGGSVLGAAFAIGTVFGLSSMADSYNAITVALNDHQTNGRQKLNDEIETKTGTALELKLKSIRRLF